jgi:hypothetical protein
MSSIIDALDCYDFVEKYYFQEWSIVGWKHAKVYQKNNPLK